MAQQKAEAQEVHLARVAHGTLAIASARKLGALAVEMETAALYAFATAMNRSVVCFAHVTNAMARSEGDFEKGEADGTTATLAVIAATARAWSNTVIAPGK